MLKMTLTNSAATLLSQRVVFTVEKQLFLFHPHLISTKSHNSLISSRVDPTFHLIYEPVFCGRRTGGRESKKT